METTKITLLLKLKSHLTVSIVYMTCERKNQEMSKSLNQMKANQTIPEVNEISMHRQQEKYRLLYDQGE